MQVFEFEEAKMFTKLKRLSVNLNVSCQAEQKYGTVIKSRTESESWGLWGCALAFSFALLLAVF